MRFLISGKDFGNLLSERVGAGKCILFRYGPGTGGDVLLKQFLSDPLEGVHSILLSTHETEKDLLDSVKEMDLPPDLEMISLLSDLNDGLDGVSRKDRFRTDGIMVTDLLEMSSNTSYERSRGDGKRKVLASITSIALKQVLPFRMVVDSIADLARKTSGEEVERRINILKGTLEARGGTVILSEPLGSDLFREHETTLFDAVISLRADNSSGTWKRTMVLENLKGSHLPPDEWDVTTVRNIQNAVSLD